MPELDVLHVVRGGIEALRLVHDLVGWREDELGVLVDELLDQPWTGDTIDLHAFAGDPLHGRTPCWWSMIFVRKPVSIPDQVRDRPFRDHALVGAGMARALRQSH